MIISVFRGLRSDYYCVFRFVVINFLCIFIYLISCLARRDLSIFLAAISDTLVLRWRTKA